jgi:predicted NBD/HSP70 family sugar kinase
MRTINTRHFRVATRSTPREVNRQIVLNLVREPQPTSRAELALAVDVRSSHTSLALADFEGRVLAKDTIATPERPEALVAELAERGARLLGAHAGAGAAAGDPVAVCEGLGLVVPGMVDRRTGRVIYAPRLGWRNLELRDALAARLGCPVYVESAPIACAFARFWLSPDETRGVHSFAYVSISDGVGVGLVVAGEPLRGDAHTAGEFGHVSLDPTGPACVCGKRGCWAALVCNSATIARYVEAASTLPREEAVTRRREPTITVEDVVRQAERGDHAAEAALTGTGRNIGRGLAAVVSAFNPGRIYVGGEVTAAWPLLEGPMRLALAEGTLTEAGHATPVVPDRHPAEYRVLGAVALVAAPTFAAPRVG